MSDVLEITGGGAISVDPEQMRAVADRMAAVAARIADAGYSVGCAQQSLSSSGSAAIRADLPGLRASAQALADESDGLTTDAEGVRIMADAFELADLRSQQELLSVKYPARADRLQARIDELVASHPGVNAMATILASAWGVRSHRGLFGQPLDQLAFTQLPLSTFGMVSRHLFGGVLRGVTSVKGSIPYGVGLTGEAPPVAVAQVSSSRVDGSAVTLKQLVQRLPGGEAQVAVEKRTHVDGAVSYVAYIGGTRDFGSGGDDPWDMGSNWDLYMDREPSAAYAATLEALTLAGAEPGARVDVVGYSQGGAIASSLAMSGMYETSQVMIVGSPTVPALDADQTLIRAFHTDDPVGAGLSGGGPVGTTGSSESFTVSREYATHGEPTSLLSHLRDAYDQTLDLTDASGDTRVVAIHETLAAEADDIVSVERTEYRATRP